MHPSSLAAMRGFVEQHLTVKGQRVLDVGSADVPTRRCASNYRALFAGHRYVGLDVAKGSNVDIVAELYAYPFRGGAFDVVVSGQVIEHVEDLAAWLRELSRVLAPGGLMCLIGPWSWEPHRFPIDCWRILPDGMRYLMLSAGLVVVTCEMSGCDTIGVARKPDKFSVV